MSNRHSEAARRTWADPEVRAKRIEGLRNGNSRRWTDPEERRKQSERRFGKTLNDEQRAALRLVRQAQWNRQMDEMLAQCERHGECTIYTKSKKVPYRRVWTRHNGPPAFGIHIHHMCGNSRCINIEHLQAVQPDENNAEMIERTKLKRQIKKLEDEAFLQSAAVYLLGA